MLSVLLFLTLAADTTRKPNVVVILADDLGYGDVRCYNPTRGKIATPNLDALAAAGMRFTDAHSSSGVCSPTRYSLLTGRYHWRTRLQRGIVGVWGAPLIAPHRLTLGGLARKAGHHTSCIGKWHLGWDWPIPEAQAKHFRAIAVNAVKAPTETTAEQVAAWKEVLSRPIPGGPTTRGFDEYFGTDVPNWPPYCYIDNDRTVGVPSQLLPIDQLKDHQASLQGPALPGWKLDAVLPALADRACETIAKRAKSGKPFLLYMPLTSPHTPIAVAKEWQGRSDLHRYADFVMQTDAVVGRVLKALDTAGVADDTLVVFTSDNGFASYVGAKELESKGHFPSGPLRGYKADAWEGGHRVPMIVRWPGVVKPNTTCRQTVCSVDLMATIADALGMKVPAGAGEDSVSLMPLLRGGDEPIHDAVVHHSANGVFAIRAGRWKLIFGPGRGAPDGTKPHLYDLEADVAESKDVAADHPEEVKRLTALMQKKIAAHRNDVPVVLMKAEEKKPEAKVMTFKKASGVDLQLHVFAPADVKEGDGRTGIVFFFGGGWNNWNPAQFEPFARHFAARGCVAICAEYRVASRHRTKPADAVADAKSAIRFVRQRAKELGIDPGRVVASGGSSGGHLAACVTSVPGHSEEKEAKDADAAANALVLFNPALDTSTIRGGAMKAISPMHHVRPGLPPTLILHGTADKAVPFAQAEAYAKRMKDAKNVCEVEAFDGRGHGFFNSPSFRKAAKAGDYEACVARMERFLRDQKLLPSGPR